MTDIHQFKGWGIDHSGQTIPRELWIILKSKKEFFIAKAKRYDRPDVVAHFAHDCYLKAGFFLNARLGSIPIGNYSLKIGQRLEDGRVHTADTGTKILKN